MTESICSADGCLRSIARPKHGLCEKHYYRKRRTGTTESPNEAKERFINSVLSNPTNDCVIWPFAVDAFGYGLYKRTRAHRELLARHTGINPKNKVAAHGQCHNPSCVNPHESHGLRWATQAENSKDRERDGTAGIGESHPGSFLTEAIVRSIRRDNRKWTLIALDYKCSITHVGSIKARRTWKHVA